MADTRTVPPGLIRLGKDAEQVASRYPRPEHEGAEAWHAFPVEIPDGLDKLADGHCGYGS